MNWGALPPLQTRLLRDFRPFPLTGTRAGAHSEANLGLALHLVQDCAFQTSPSVDSTEEPDSSFAVAANLGVAWLWLFPLSSKLHHYHISANNYCQRQNTLTVGWAGGGISYIMKIYLQKQQAQNLFLTAAIF